MIDCSRGAVLTIDSVYDILRRSALMGLNTFLLYTEDTYEVNSALCRDALSWRLTFRS
jgi:hexosaminidase